MPGHQARCAMGTQRVGDRMKPLLVKEQLRPSEAPSCGKGQAHSDASGAHVPVGETDQQKKTQGQGISGSHVCAENMADIREGLGPGGLTANEEVSGRLRGGDF